MQVPLEDSAAARDADALRRSRKRRIRRADLKRQARIYRLNALRYSILRTIGRAPPRYRLALCLCFRNAASYLREWIEFHRLVGVEHFFLYNNDSDDDFRPVLEPYIREGIVTFHDWPGARQQHAIYDHCLRTYGPRARWIGFFDDDEFLFSPERDSVPEVLQDYESQAGIQVAGIVFGTSGHVKRPPGGVIENFTACAADLTIHGKCIVDPEQTLSFKNVHHALLRKGAALVDENLTVCRGKFSPTPTSKRLRFNHYECKSVEELQMKMARGDAARGGTHSYAPDTSRGQRMMLAEKDRNTDILRFLPRLNEALTQR